MKQKRLGNICRSILDRLNNGRQMDEDSVHIFFEGIVDKLQSMDGKEPPEYQKLVAKMDEMWQYRQLEEISPELIFLCGGLWGGAKVLKLCRKREKQQISLDLLVRKYKSEEWIFRVLSENPGIKHKDLAEKGRVSISRLSQLTATMQREGLITYNRVGREKYYYLRPEGEKVYDRLDAAHVNMRRDYLAEIKHMSLRNSDMWTLNYVVELQPKQIRNTNRSEEIVTLCSFKEADWIRRAAIEASACNNMQSRIPSPEYASSWSISNESEGEGNQWEIRKQTVNSMMHV